MLFENISDTKVWVRIAQPDLGVKISVLLVVGYFEIGKMNKDETMVCFHKKKLLWAIRREFVQKQRSGMPLVEQAQV